MLPPGELDSLGVVEAAARIADGHVSAVELTATYLERIAALDSQVNAFITVMADEAVAQARRIEVELEQGEAPGPLAGVPIALKDLFDTAGVRTTAGSRFFADRVPNRDAVVVEKLRGAGAVLLGKLNMHEWALGVTNDNPHYGACHNPRRARPHHRRVVRRIRGRHRGGDVRRRVRQRHRRIHPHSGLVMRRGRAQADVRPSEHPWRGTAQLESRHVGPMARRVADVAQLLQVIGGWDAADPGSASAGPDDYVGELESGVSGWRVGVIADEWLGDVDPEVQAAVRAAVEALASAGAWIEELAVPELPEAAHLNGLMTTADAAAFHRERMEQAPDDFGADVLRRLRRGAAHSAAEYADARRRQTLLRRSFESWFVEHGGALDVVILPDNTLYCAAHQWARCGDDGAAPHAPDGAVQPHGPAGVVGAVRHVVRGSAHRAADRRRAVGGATRAARGACLRGGIVARRGRHSAMMAVARLTTLGLAAVVMMAPGMGCHGGAARAVPCRQRRPRDARCSCSRRTVTGASRPRSASGWRSRRRRARSSSRSIARWRPAASIDSISS
jgi:aspartyl-tRNA(Asn)/glutamyl-tRNA(Gln) amidotransferase subunit A